MNLASKVDDIKSESMTAEKVYFLNHEVSQLHEKDPVP